MRYVWSASSDGDGYVRNVHDDGDRDNCNPNKRLVAARPDLLLKRSEKVVTGKAAIMFLKNGPV